MCIEAIITIQHWFLPIPQPAAQNRVTVITDPSNATHWNRVHTVTGAKSGLQRVAWSSRASCKVWSVLAIPQCNVTVGSVTVGIFRRSPYSLLCALPECMCQCVDVNM